MSTIQVLSPLTQSSNTVFERFINTSDIVKGYANEYKVDVSSYFESLEKILVYKCLDTGFKFYCPFNIAGDGIFYQKLQEFDWYYMDWKWEHQTALKHIQKGQKILEIGCAKGAFIQRLSKLGIEAVGLELNEEAVALGEKINVKILNEPIQVHAKNNSEAYDVVCSFQVMEHISDIREVLESSVASLKVGGNLIISVPNNDSFLGKSVNYLNMPPHHMGLWNEEVFKSIPKIFSLKLTNIHFEPLQEYHKSYFVDTMTDFYGKKYKTLSFIGKPILSKVIRLLTPWFSSKARAFTIQAVFEKL